MLRIAITAWIAGGSAFLFLPKLPNHGLEVSIISGIFLLIIGYYLRDRNRTISLLFLIAAMAALGWGYHFHYAKGRLASSLPISLEDQELTIRGYIDQLPNSDRQHQRFAFEVVDWNDVQSESLPRKIYLSWSGAWQKNRLIPELAPGEEWQFVVKLKRPHTLMNDHGFDFERWMFHQGFGAHGSVRSGKRIQESKWISLKTAIEYQRWRLRNKIKAALDPSAPYVGVLIALVIGDQNAIAQSDWRVFNATGVGHLISISGLHVTMLSGLGAMLGAWIWRRREWPLVIPVQKVAAGTGLLTAFLYAWLAGFQIPAQRTLYMVGIVAFALWTSRIPRAFDIWWIALLLVLVIDPMAPYTPGFWLSFGAVAIILFGMGSSSSLIGIPNGSEWERSRLERFKQALLESCRLQWIVTIALIPCTLYWFYQVSVVSPLANTLAIPVISFIVTPLAIVGAILPEWFAPIPLQLAHGAMEWTAKYLNWLTKFDWAVHWSHQPTLWAMALSTVGIYWHIRPGPMANHLISRIVGLALCAPLFWQTTNAIHEGQFRAYVFDIGQGTAVLVETKSHRLLYDAGPLSGKNDNAGERVLLPYFRGEGIDRLDRLVISHKDLDHIAGASTLMKSLQIESFLGTMPEHHPLMNDVEQSFMPALPCQFGQEWQWDGVDFKVWHPSAEVSFKADTHRGKPNENSCVLEIRNNNTSFWLTGDIEKRGEHEHTRRLEEMGYQKPNKVVVMAPHHGSKTSSSQIWLDAIQPTVAFSQHGYRNRYGHPHSVVKERYRDNQTPLLETIHTGAQHWHATADELTVEFLRPKQKRLWHHD